MCPWCGTYNGTIDIEGNHWHASCLERFKNAIMLLVNKEIGTYGKEAVIKALQLFEK